MDAYRKQIRAFRRKFGREMRADDPFFFDPDKPTPQFPDPSEAEHAMEILMDLMSEAGIEPEAIYAFKATGGLFPMEDTPFTEDEQIEWAAAIREYREKLARTKMQ